MKGYPQCLKTCTPFHSWSKTKKHDLYSHTFPNSHSSKQDNHSQCMQYSVRQKQPAFNNAEKGTINKTLSLVLTLFLKFSCSLSLQIPPTYTISTFSLKYEPILTHNFSNVNIYLMDILIMVSFLIIVFINYIFYPFFSIHFPHFINHCYFQKYSFPAYLTSYPIFLPGLLQPSLSFPFLAALPFPNPHNVLHRLFNFRVSTFAETKGITSLIEKSILP